MKNIIIQFFNDIRDVATTRKFWVGMITAVVNAVAVFLVDTPELAPVFSLLGALGVYTAPNRY